MQLTAEKRTMLGGERGEPVRRAPELQLEVGKFYEADLLECPGCNGRMRVIALIQDPGIVHRKRNASEQPGCGKALAALSQLE